MAMPESVTEPTMRVTADVVRREWSRTIDEAGNPSWRHLYPYYAPNVVFRDPVQERHGHAGIVDVCDTLARRCSSLTMQIHSVAEDGENIFFQWTMTMAFRRTPSTEMYGCTRLTIGPDGLIVAQRDYYDIWGDIMRGIPGWRRAYSAFMRKVFG